jgi:hypothetical protein
MYIVKLKEFLELPKGTVYSGFSPNMIDTELFIKGSTCGELDWVKTQLLDALDVDDSVEYNDQLEAMLTDSSVHYPLHFHTTSRNAMYEKDKLFAVWDKEDVEGLINKLQQSLMEAYNGNV